MGLNDEVGRRLRELRTARGLTLSELARRSGVGKGTLSELESGTRNPTLETLYALTTALNRPLSAVLGGDLPPYTRQHEGAVFGSAVTAVLIERHENAEAVTDVFRITIAAGATQESAAHVAGTTESLMILSGTAVVGTLDAPGSVGPGESVCWPADTAHLYSAPHGDAHGILFVRYPAAAL
ncbi:XRE family transcriptional regulator [Streptomyces sp. NPDC021356]|uniref:helix-turn-helix domain-containing protein n=1 Tax=Streptomyces sp. NPDC021356 TaxID=3154900 RepID=UPI0033EC758E